MASNTDPATDPVTDTVTDPVSAPVTDPVSAPSDGELIGNDDDLGEIEVDIEEQEPDDDGDDYTPLSSNEDPEKQRSYKEYKRLVRDINHQNELLERIKDQIQDITQKNCPTPAEKKDLKKLYEWLEQEMQKLRSLIERAIHLQNFGSRRRYKEFPLVTTFDEDNNMKPFLCTCENMQVQSAKGQAKLKADPHWRVSGGDSSEVDKSCSCGDDHDPCHKGKHLSEAEEKKLLKDIFETLKQCASQKKQHKPCKEHSRPPCRKQDSMEDVKKKICSMQQTIAKLKEELCNREHKRSPCGVFSPDKKQDSSCGKQAVDPTLLCLKSGSKAENYEKLKDNYIYLLTEYSKKDEQLKELVKKLKSSCDKCGNGDVGKIGGTSADESEIHLLRNRITEMNEEQIEFKCLMREQSLQLEEYRNKYLSAQQKVEEQCALLEKLNMNNKRIEKQINIEIKEIRAKFQEKLNDLLQFPRLLENEQIKLAQAFKEKEELEGKLVIVCKELKHLKSKSQSPEEDCKPQLQRCQQELCMAKKNLDEMKNQRDLFCEQLRKTMEDLDSLRSESAKIIARTKERAEQIKQQQQERIDRLEKQLAQCRATACLSVSDREAVIREMQGQLNTLSYSFDAAQKQIKTLRNHIAYMSNENCFPAKC